MTTITNRHQDQPDLLSQRQMPKLAPEHYSGSVRKGSRNGAIRSYTEVRSMTLNQNVSLFLSSKL